MTVNVLEAEEQRSEAVLAAVVVAMAVSPFLLYHECAMFQFMKDSDMGFKIRFYLDPAPAT
jgi:hypothetical protein